MSKRLSGLEIVDITPGEGDTAQKGDIVTFCWRGWLNHGEKFGQGYETMRVGSRHCIAGLAKGILGMRVGGIRRLEVSPHLAYRDKPPPGIPSNAVLHFEVELLNMEQASNPGDSRR